MPSHLWPLADILGPEVEVPILQHLYNITGGNINTAINRFYEGDINVPPHPVPSTPSNMAPSSVQTTTSISSVRHGQSTVGVPANGSTRAATSIKRKASDNFFPKYIGELTVTGYALAAMVKVSVGDPIRIERARPQSSSSGRSKKSGGGQSKENNVVRFTNKDGYEIGRLPVDVARWVSKLMDFELAQFRGTIIYAPSILKTGTEVIFTMRCYLTAKAFLSLDKSNLSQVKQQQGVIMGRDSVETAEELSLKNRKFAVNTMFRDLALKPSATNATVGPREHDNDLLAEAEPGSPSSSSPSVAKQDGQEGSKDGGEEEEEKQVSDSELDVLYEKAQQHGREFAPIEPPSTMTYTLKPYQKQALAWMIYKEQLERTSDDHLTLHPLWEQYDFPLEEDHEVHSDDPRRFYLNPYSSEMSLEFPTSAQACRGGILADEMGLGKTIEILSLIHANRLDNAALDPPEEAFSKLSTSVRATTATTTTTTFRPSKTTLIVCPMSLISQWRDEAVRSSDGSLKIEVYYGNSRDLSDVELTRPSAPDILITSYGTIMSEYCRLAGLDPEGSNNNNNNKSIVSTLQGIRTQADYRRGSALFNVDFYRVVLDEAHQIKSRLTKTSKACYAINGVRRWVVTGTPIQNKLEDLFSLVHFMRAEPWSNFSFWRTFITIPFESKDKDKALKVVTSVLEPLVLRRTKTTKDENGDPIIMLPEKSIEIEYLDFSEQENDIYQALFKDGKTKFSHYCAAGTVLKNYASIFQLLMRPQANGQQQQQGGGGLGLKDGPVNLEELMAKFSASEDQPGSNFGASVIQNLIQSSDEVPECPICFEDMADGVLMPCMHRGCRSCVLDYLQRRDDAGEQGDCPICRQGPITEADLMEYTTTTTKPIPSSSERSTIQGDNILDMSTSTRGGGDGGEGSSGSNSNNNSNGSSSRTVQIRRNIFKSSAKLDALMRHLQRQRQEDPQTKSVVFSQFTGMLDLAAAILDRDGFEHVRLDGSLSQANREKCLEQFRDPDHPARVMLISLRAGGVGLNLTAANRVFMLDPWWNYAIESQAIDRVHRIGQQRPVVVKRFIVRNTVEEKILVIQNRKNAIASTLGMTKAESQGARMEDLQDIFS
ncbi:DNA helicase rad5 [Actinomortierella ambigua]|uniref:DNA helicase rad5 n=1 Tax=Actinomortierella ambigua TaxID=1343610 RepID=A0A9P6QDZ2_9FUNG|nr:DNA helicase rad5 [Actinomortierella ambigua]